MTNRNLGALAMGATAGCAVTVVVGLAVQFGSASHDPTEFAVLDLQRKLREQDAENQHLKLELDRLEHRLHLQSLQRVEDEALEADAVVKVVEQETGRLPVDVDEIDFAQLQDTVNWLKALSPDEYGNMLPEEVQFLRKLALHNHELTDADLQHIGTLHRLLELNLGGCTLSDESLAHLSDLSRLESVNLEGSTLKGPGLRYLNSPNLKWLNIERTKATDESLEFLRNMPSLEKVKLNDAQITDRGMYALGSCRSLRQIELDRCELTENGVEQLLRLNPDLERIEVRGIGLDDESYHRLAQQFPDVDIERGGDSLAVYDFIRRQRGQ